MAKEAGKLEYEILTGKAPVKQPGKSLCFKDTKNLRALPAGLECFSLDVSNTDVESLPEDLRVEYKLDLTRCRRLKSLPRGLSTGTLVLRECNSLEALPEDMKVSFLMAEGCTRLAHWPESAQVSCGSLDLTRCRSLTALPSNLKGISSLNLRGCNQLQQIPEGTVVTSWVDVGETALTGLPKSMQGAAIRWRGVAVDARIAFFPEALDATEVLTESNMERRRIILERVGHERFIKEAQPEVIHTDKDAGGERRLLRVKMAGDEDLVVVHVRCPSTAREYLIRVPPTMRTCHQAVAWTAGFDNPDDYAPVLET
jgi:hypothetical protein